MQARDRFAPRRRPVLGLAIESTPDDARHRLVDVDAGVLVEGDLERCEEELVRVLRERHGRGHPNLEMPTLGGMQLWSDVFWFADWRIQEHVYTGHFRLLDPLDARHAWGTLEACRAAFEDVRLRERLTLPSDHLVVLLHGLGRTRQTFSGMRGRLGAAGFAVATVEYASTRRSIEEHARGLDRVLDALDGVRRVSFVTHSLGGIVVRASLAGRPAWRERLELGRMVMLAPPSNGAQVARALRELLPFRFLAGPSGVELGAESLDYPPPPCPFGIVAAARGGDRGWNPLLEGADDGVLALEETVLAGASDTLTVPGFHTYIMQDREVIDATANFLVHGVFAGVEPR